MRGDRNNGGGGGGGGRQRRRVRDWETLETIHDRKERVGGEDIRVLVEIKQPVFEDNARGFPKMNATLCRGERYLRLSCFDGDVTEIRTLGRLLAEVMMILDYLPEKYDSYVDAYRAGRHRGDDGEYADDDDERSIRRHRRRRD